MKRQPGGSVVQPGFYWNPSDWQIAVIERGPAPLPGGAEDRFVKLPGLAVMALAPALGLSLVMFLPVAGFAVVASEAARRTASAVGRLARRRPA
jgi:hypothetical protein